MDNHTLTSIIFGVLWGTVIVLNFVTLVVAVVSACLLNHDMNKVLDQKQQFIASSRRYQTYYTTMTGVEKQDPRIPSWVYTVTAFAEASYRQHGVQSGFLDEDKYVAFSEEFCLRAAD